MCIAQLVQLDICLHDLRGYPSAILTGTGRVAAGTNDIVEGGIDGEAEFAFAKHLFHALANAQVGREEDKAWIG